MCVTVFSPDMMALRLLVGLGGAGRAVLTARRVLELVGYTEVQCLSVLNGCWKQEERRDKPVRAIGLLRKNDRTQARGRKIGLRGLRGGGGRISSGG